MRHTIFHWIPSSELGGIEMAALTLIQESPQHAHVVATGDISGPAVAMWQGAGAKVTEIPSWKGCLGLAWVRHWARFVRESDVRHLISWSPTRLTMVCSPLRAEDRCLVHLGNVGGFSPRARIQDRLMRALLRPRCQPLLVACSMTVLDSVAGEPVFSGAPRLMIHNSVRRVFFDTGVRRTAHPVTTKTWGMIARLDRLKDHRTLIAAVGLLPNSIDLRLEIVGEGDLGQDLRDIVFKAGLAKRITFTGATTAPDEALSRWDGFIFSTTPAEGFGIAVAEAMAAGLPCVLSDIRAMREIAGGEAFYASAGDARALAHRLAAAVSDPAAAQAVGQAARRRAIRLYGPQEYAQSYLTALGLIPQP